MFESFLEDNSSIYNLDYDRLDEIYWEDENKRRILSPYLVDHYLLYFYVMVELQELFITKTNRVKNKKKLLLISSMHDISNKYFINNIKHNLLDYMFTYKDYSRKYSICRSIKLLFNHELRSNPFKSYGTIRFINKFAVCGQLPTRRELSFTGDTTLRNSRYIPRLISYMSRWIKFDTDIANNSSLEYQYPNGYYWLPRIFYKISCGVDDLHKYALDNTDPDNYDSDNYDSDNYDSDNGLDV